MSWRPLRLGSRRISSRENRNEAGYPLTREALECVECCTGSPVAGSVIWLHGLGADGHDFEPLVPLLSLPDLHLRYVFPHAPVRPVTINNGMSMPAWFDVIGLDRKSRQDEAGIREAESWIHTLVRRENERGIPPSEIVLAGFSQGGALALQTALRYPERLAGTVGLSCFLPLAWTVDAEARPADELNPILLAHGTQDVLVPPGLGSGTRDFLRERGYAVDWKEYPMAHEVCPEEIVHVRDYLRSRMGALP